MKIKKRPLFKVGDRVMFREATSQNSGSWENPIKVYIVTGAAGHKTCSTHAGKEVRK
jgi:hypothetical protein